MKKISLLALIFIILNFIFSSYIVSANPENPTTTESQQNSNQTDSGMMSMDDYKKIAEEGKVDIGGNERKIALNESDVGATTSKLGSALTAVTGVFVSLISKVTSDGGFYYAESDYSAEKTGFFTINSLIFNEYVLFNPKPYQKSTDLNSNISTSKITGVIDGVKQNGVELSSLISKFSLMIAVPFVMIALGKVLVAGKASDLAAWKKILASWVICVVLMVAYQYILIAMDTLADSLIDSFWKIRNEMESDGYSSFESTIEITLSQQIEQSGGVTSLAYSVVFIAIVILQILFLIKYVVRTFGIMFLFMLAPVIILIHSIKLMLGRESNMLGSLFKNYASLVFLQPIHILFYLIFFFSLSELAMKVPVLGVILLYALYRSEKIIKAMFGWDFGMSIFSLKS